MMTRWTRSHVLLVLGLTLLTTVPALAGGMFSANGGLVAVQGDVGELLAENGINLSVEGFLMPSGNVAFGGGFSVAPLSSDNDFIDSIGAVTLHGSLRFYPVTTVPGPRFFFGGVFGFGALAWEYPDGVSPDSDGIGFMFFGPEAGVELFMNDQFFLQGKVRYMLTNYADETSEDLIWDIEGGEMLVIEAGVGVGF